MHHSVFATALLAMSVTTCYGELQARFPLFDNVSLDLEIGNGNGNNNGNGNGVANNKAGTGPAVIQPIIQTVPDYRTLVTSAILTTATATAPAIADAAVATPAAAGNTMTVAQPNIPVAQATPDNGQATTGKTKRRRSNRLMARNPILGNVGVKLKIGNGNGLNNGNGNGVANGWPANVDPNVLRMPPNANTENPATPATMAANLSPAKVEPAIPQGAEKKAPEPHSSSETGAPSLRKRYHYGHRHYGYGRDCAGANFFLFFFRACI
ncbi:hypothetical protein AA313_de0203124 [Arthrobotrys entomopaga]|nr:hypothetical protein AA313_de0203124 [Arthrobotrys entomopaga]